MEKNTREIPLDQQANESKMALAWPIHQLRNTQKSQKGTQCYITCYNKNQEM